MSSSPNTRCRVRPSSRMTWSSIATASCGSQNSPTTRSAGSIEDQQGRGRAHDPAPEAGRPDGHAQSRDGARRQSVAVAAVPGWLRKVLIARRINSPSGRSAGRDPAGRGQPDRSFTDPASSMVDGQVWTRTDAPNSNFIASTSRARKLTEIGPRLDPEHAATAEFTYGMPVDIEGAQSLHARFRLTTR